MILPDLARESVFYVIFVMMILRIIRARQQEFK
jgi:hypothetical protein